MLATLALVVLMQSTDTTVFTVQAVLDRAAEVSPTLAASRVRSDAADSRVRQAGAWTNPTVTATAENLGAALETTGIPAWRGTEGQILLGLRLPIGGDRGAAIRSARAAAGEASALERVAERDVDLDAVVAISAWLRERAVAGHAGEDAAGLARLATDARRRADAGRASEGDAARLLLASASASARAARARTTEATASTELARLLGLDPATIVEVALPTCSWEGLPDPGALPDLEAAEARVEQWAAARSELTAAAIPDLRPQIGWRRSAGFDAVYFGLEFELPLFHRNQGARAAAGLEMRAAEEEHRDLTRRFDAARQAAGTAVRELTAAGAGFDARWREALDRAVTSAETRYELGEGTLSELLDSRRARLQALDDFEAWREQLFLWRARWARTSGAELNASLFCEPTPITTNRGDDRESGASRLETHR